MAVNLSQPLTMAEIARAAGTDRHLLSRTFMEETGMTLKRYLAKRRCEIAAELLRAGGTSVQEVPPTWATQTTTISPRCSRPIREYLPRTIRSNTALPHRPIANGTKVYLIFSN